MVYFLSAEEGEIYSYGMKALDGDIKKIKPLDLTPDGGREILPIRGKFGRPLEGDHIPTRVQIEGPKRKLTDLREGIGTFVDASFRAEVEKLEPEVHQFFPVEFLWKDGSHACHRFWFVPCNRSTVSIAKRRLSSFAVSGFSTAARTRSWSSAAPKSLDAMPGSTNSYPRLAASGSAMN